jgi:hypothetical protein
MSVGGTQSRPGQRGEEKVRYANSDPSVIQPVASRYTDRAVIYDVPIENRNETEQVSLEVTLLICIRVELDSNLEPRHISSG